MSKPEDVIAGKPRPFTGAEYLESLRDGREVWIYGERVDDVTTHKAFRNSARSLARLYDALHDPAQRDVLTCPTDTGTGTFTHKFFRIARSREDLIGQRDAIAHWARMTYGWMGRTPDYKASLMNTLGTNDELYGQYAPNAKAWHRRAQDYVLFMNHAIVNPPVDRDRAAEQVKDVFITIQKETDAGIYVSGAKVVATSSAITHYNFLGQNAAMPLHDPDMAVMFITPMDTPGVKLICRTSYEMAATLIGTPFDYPLSSRFDENDAIFVFDNAFVPWENVLICRDIEKIKTFYPNSGFINGFQFQGCTRLAVKLDFLVGVIAKALRTTGADEFRGNQALLGEVIAWRNMFWAISDAMAMNPVPWVGDSVLPNAQSGASYRVFAGDAYRRVREIVDKLMASALIYLPSSAKDFKNPEIDKYLARYVRGSHGIGYKERIKIMKLLWDAIGTEFGGRHELYEMNYAGNHEDIRIWALWNARGSGALDRMVALAEECMADYDEDGWIDPTWLNPDDVAQGSPAAGSPGTSSRKQRRNDRLNRMNWIDQRPDDAMAGAFEAIAPDPLKSVDAAAFRDGMSRLGAAVHVVTSDGPGGKTGFTATAVASVSDAPPTLLVCLNRRSNSAPVLSANRVFCVNTLRAGEEEIADRFAGRTGNRDDRFASGEWLTLGTGSPVLASAVAAFDCRISEVKTVGSHHVIFGVVEAVRLGGSGEALVYHERAYKRV